MGVWHLNSKSLVRLSHRQLQSYVAERKAKSVGAECPLELSLMMYLHDLSFYHLEPTTDFKCIL